MKKNKPYVSIVIPAHNCSKVISNTINVFRRYFEARNLDFEIIVIENGSTDDTWEKIQSLYLENPSQLKILKSTKGMGSALHRGIMSSVGRFILLTADDLPFGTSDIDGFLKSQEPRFLLIGSKSHEDSKIEREIGRRLLTYLFFLLRKCVLSSKVRDSQGTFYADGLYLRRICSFLTEKEFLFTTELVYLTELIDIRITELPVNYRSRMIQKKSSVSFQTALNMLFGVLRLRRIHSRHKDNLKEYFDLWQSERS